MAAEAPEPITPSMLRSWGLPAPGASKHGRGHVLVIGGSRSTPGAAWLAGLAALRVGAGVLALAVPESVAIALAIAIPESGVTGWQTDSDGMRREDAEALTALMQQADAILVGPGLDTVERTSAVIDVVKLAEISAPLVLDAFALGTIAEDEQRPHAHALPAVLTPNSAEAGRLLHRDLGSDEPAWHVCGEIAARWNAVVSFGGVICDPDGRSRVIETGHPGLGTSGSGDVLAGLVVGLLARGADAFQAACWGTYLHAASGDRLAARIGRLGFLARELLDEVPLVLTQLQA